MKVYQVLSCYLHVSLVEGGFCAVELLGGEPQRAVATDANPHAARVVPRTATDQLGDVIGVGRLQRVGGVAEQDGRALDAEGAFDLGHAVDGGEGDLDAAEPSILDAALYVTLSRVLPALKKNTHVDCNSSTHARGCVF